MEPKLKTRSPNFTAQECLLLAQLMGEPFKNMALSRHKVDKHKFNERITSATKKLVWADVEEQYNACQTSGPRKSIDLQKKWENLVSKHRAIYADYRREINMTGSGPTTTKYSLLTEAVMDVIGVENVSVVGTSGVTLDTTFNQLRQQQDQESTVQRSATLSSSDECSVLGIDTGIGPIKKQICNCCHCDEELLELKKKKIKLEIKVLQRTLQSEI